MVNRRAHGLDRFHVRTFVVGRLDVSSRTNAKLLRRLLPYTLLIISSEPNEDCREDSPAVFCLSWRIAAYNHRIDGVAYSVKRYKAA